MISLRKLIAFLCVLVVLWTALMPASSAQLWAILIPFLLPAGILTSAVFECSSDNPVLPKLVCLSVVAPRAPPLA
jgi:hypothetical protein